MKIYEWNSYSCNNSSDIRLVAKFKSEQKAQQMFEELTFFLEEHAVEYDKKRDDGIFVYPGEATEVAKRFGQKYNHEWTQPMLWGDDRLEGDEPEVGVLNNSLILHHTYTSSFGSDLGQVFKNAGATEVAQYGGAPIIFVEAIFKEENNLERELVDLFEQRHHTDIDGWKFPWELKDELRCENDLSFVNEITKCSFILNLPVTEFSGLKTYLKHNAKSFSMRLASPEDIEKNKKKDIEAREER